MFEHEEQEILDVVNDNDEIIGTTARSDIMTLKDTPGRYLRTVEIFIQRPNGDIYLPRRSTERKIAPGGLDASASGHISSGESYEQGSLRELKEETGIEAEYKDLTAIGKIGPSAVLFYFRQLYLLRTDKTPRLSPEHTEAIWVQPDKLEDFIRNDIPTKQTLDDDIPLLVNYLKDNSQTKV